MSSTDFWFNQMSEKYRNYVKSKKESLRPIDLFITQKIGEICPNVISTLRREKSNDRIAEKDLFDYKSQDKSMVKDIFGIRFCPEPIGGYSDSYVKRLMVDQILTEESFVGDLKPEYKCRTLLVEGKEVQTHCVTFCEHIEVQIVMYDEHVALSKSHCHDKYFRILSMKVESTLPPIETNDLLQRKIASPNNRFEIQEKIDLITQCIQYGELEVEKAKMIDEDLFLCVGKMRYELTSLIDYIGSFENTNSQPYSLTPMVRIAEREALAFCHFPHFFDHDDRDVEIINTINMKNVLSSANSICIVVSMSYEEASDSTGRELIQASLSLFGNEAKAITHAKSMLFAVYGAPLSMTSEAMQDAIKTFSSRMQNPQRELLENFAPRVILYQLPTASSKRTEPSSDEKKRRELRGHLLRMTAISEKSVLACNESITDNTGLSSFIGSVKTEFERLMRGQRDNLLKAGLVFDSLLLMRGILQPEDTTINECSTMIRDVLLPIDREVRRHCGSQDFDRTIEALHELRDTMKMFDMNHLQTPSFQDLLKHCKHTLTMPINPTTPIYEDTTHHQDRDPNLHLRELAVRAIYEDKDAVAPLIALSEEGDLLAVMAMSILYYHGIGIGEDEEKAKGLAARSYGETMESARGGDPLAQWLIGRYYFNGIHESADDSEAFKWYSSSAERGFVLGQSDCGFCYYYGCGISIDRSIAKHWFTLAVNQGDPGAKEFLARLIF